jgi:holo-[acyl-carrier protein] synthase
MIGLGLDVVELDRFRSTLARTPSFGRRVFTADEVAYAEARHDPTERYAVRFAAKEAVLKAMGLGLWSFPLREIEVVRADSGEPAVQLHGRGAELAAERDIARWHLTMCHTERIAVALAVALDAGASLTVADAAEIGRVVTDQLVAEEGGATSR